MVSRKSSIEELENKNWGAPTYPSNLVVECHRLRKIPLEELSVENLRMLIGQKIGLLYLIPTALEILEENPWISGDFYEGDLLENVLKVEIGFWEEKRKLWDRLALVMQKASINNQPDRKKLFGKWIELKSIIN